MDGWEHNNGGVECHRFSRDDYAGKFLCICAVRLTVRSVMWGKMLGIWSIDWMVWIGVTFVREVIRFALLADGIR